MRQLVGDDIGDVLLFRLRRRGRVDEEERLAERDATEVLHRTCSEVGQRKEVDLLARIRNAVVVLEPLQRERPDLQPERREVLLAGHVDDAQRYTADVHRLRRFERADDHRHEVGGHHHRVLEADGDLAAVGARARCLSAVRDGHQRGVDDEGDAEHGLQFRLVPARERPPTVGRLHLARGDDLLVAGRIDVGGSVPTAQPVVEHAGEHHLDGDRTGIELDRQAERAALGGLVEGDLRRVRARRGLDLGRRDLQFGGVAHERRCLGVDIKADGDVPPERGRVEIGLEQDVVAVGGGLRREAERTVRHGGAA